jgi:5-formaminoimidazole-4-carboxamide-1-(beta)-D-ribofuranosyl 5'-monophosphate synthetase
MNADHPAIATTLASYDLQQLTLCSIGSHSALEVAAGANAAGLRNLIVAERGRERTYTEHFAKRSDPPRGCVDQTIVLNRFSDILDANVQSALVAANVIFLPNRSISV